MARSQNGLSGAGEWYQFQKLISDLKNKTVLDLGCGYGWHCQYAIDSGAKEVIGIDASYKMLDEARKRHSHSLISYENYDLCHYTYPPHTFDVVISNLVLHYIEDLEEIYHNVFQCLKENGTFVFNIEHPTFTSGVHQDWIYDQSGKPIFWPIDDYFLSNERITSFLGCEVKKYHHTLTQIINGLIQTGFQIECIEEVVPPLEMMNIPGMKDELRRPMMLLVKARKEKVYD